MKFRTSGLLRATTWVALALISGLAWAADEEPRIEEVVVSAHPLSAEGLAQAAEIMQADELRRSVATGIGETLGAQPGVHSANFGAAASRPVIHGLGGPRVRVMEDRLDTLDVSVTSADHAVSVEPYLAEQVEILKGPSTLLYGSGAVGGVVDVHTGRIPHELPEETISGGVETRYDTSNEGQASLMKLNAGIGKFAIHLDGVIKDGNEYDIPGFAESARLRAQEEAEGGEEGEEEEEEARDQLPGSQFDFESYAGGVSFIDDWGFGGFAISRIEADYGLPGGHHHEEEEGEEEEEEEGNPVLELEQTRFDGEVALRDPFGPFSSLNIRVGYNDYQHMEIEPSGEVATTFDNEAFEFRSELAWDQDGWAGATGLQHSNRKFSAVGEEAFVPPVDTRESGAFVVAERAFDTHTIEGGVRLGRVDHESSTGLTEAFTTWSLSVGAIVPLENDWRLSMVTDLTSRAPVAEELFSNGPHLATNAFEIGDPTLDNEQAFNLAMTAERLLGRWTGRATFYHTRFADFIFEVPTGAEQDELPVFQFLQDDANFTGIDAEVLFQASEWEGGSLMLRGQLDAVRARRRDGGGVGGNDNLPRIPPLRYGLGLEANHAGFSLSINYLRVAEQDDTAPLELVTDDYDDLRIHAEYVVPLDRAELVVFATGRNLTDDEQRQATSFIKEFAPQPGRNAVIGLRLDF